MVLCRSCILKDACIEFMVCSNVMVAMAVGNNTKLQESIEALDKTNRFCRAYIIAHLKV